MRIALTNDDHRVLSLAIQAYGTNWQLLQAIQELSELIQALTKNYRFGSVRPNTTEEMADSIIVISELLKIYDNRDAVSQVIEEKMQRLWMRSLATLDARNHGGGYNE